MTIESFNEELLDQIKNESIRFQFLKDEIAQVIVGNDNIIHFIIVALLCNGHILLEGVPGVAKTTTIKAITNALGLLFKRIQFTPDLLPADLIGTLIYNPKTQEFETKKGPIFANLVLADEINRTPAKVQAALLEAMEEQQITIGSTTYQLEAPFFVLATQNPIEQEGTYRLPEAQIDRFMFKLIVGYLNPEQEKEILHKTNNSNNINKILEKESLFTAQKIVKQIYVDQKIIDYLIQIVFATRIPNQYNLSRLKPYIEYGVSPRATLALYRAAQAHAFLKKRHFVTPDDIKAVSPAILRHRISLTYEADADNVTVDNIIQEVLSTISTP
ncbi:MAG: MoxR family ATPase [Candidatus Babeliales bacterium]